MLSVVFIFIFNHAERVWLSLFYLISLVAKIKCWNFTFLKTTDTLNVCISTCHITLGLYVYELMFMSRGRRHGGAMTVWRPRRLPSERALFEIVIQCCKRKTTAYFYWDITTCWCDVSGSKTRYFVNKTSGHFSSCVQPRYIQVKGWHPYQTWHIMLT